MGATEAEGPPVSHVVLFRNVNQGQRGQPSTSDLLAALADAGCGDAVAFQSNGTLVVRDRDRGPDHLIAEAAASLAARTGTDHEVFVMPFDHVVTLVEAHADAPDAARRELTLHRGGVIDGDDPVVVAEAARRRCRVVAAGQGWTVTTNERDRESNATPTVERLTAGPATSRGLPTLVRLIDRFSR